MSDAERVAASRSSVLSHALGTGVLTAYLVGGVAEPIAVLVHKTGSELAAKSFVATLSLLPGLYMPLGLALAIGLASTRVILRWARGNADPMGWRTPHPFLFAYGIVSLTAAVALYFGVQRTSLFFLGRFHNHALAAYLLAALIIVFVGFAAALVFFLGPRLQGLSGRLGRGASPLVLLVLWSAAAVAVTAIVLRSLGDDVRRALDLRQVLWIAVTAVAFVIVLLFLRRLSLPVASRKRLAIFNGGMALVALGLTASCAFRLVERNRARAIIEQRSVFGLQLIRLYQSWTDADGDGHSWAFGGRDCDDHNPRIHPGAADRARDGIDSDCFAGDGYPPTTLLGDGHYAPVPPNFTKPNIVVFLIDTLRPDHVGAYGYRRPITKNIDAFVTQACLFEQAISQSSRTLYALPPMLTGLYPSEIRYGDEQAFRAVDPATIMIPELLHGAGYETVGLFGSGYFSRIPTFLQGFDRLDISYQYRPARNEVVDDADRELERLADAGKPFFLWVHYFNVHEPHLSDDTPSKFGRQPIDEYDTEIALADEQFGRLLDILRARNLEDNTIVVLASDHGEAFLEHGTYFHSQSLYDEETLATLAIRMPGSDARRVKEPVALFDLAPTFLNLAGVAVPAPTAARSLIGVVTGARRPDENRPILSELMPDGKFLQDIKTIRMGNHKLHWWVHEGTFALFDLAKDPGERIDLSDDRPELAERLLRTLRGWTSARAVDDNLRDAIIERNRLTKAPRAMTRRLDARFAEGFTILGYDLPSTHVRLGETLDLTLYYRVNARVEKNLRFELSFTPLSGSNRFNFHTDTHFPLGARYFTNEWQPGEILRDPMPVPLPQESGLRPPLTYLVRLRVFDESNNVVQPIDGSGGGLIEIATVQVDPGPPRPPTARRLNLQPQLQVPPKRP